MDHEQAAAAFEEGNWPPPAQVTLGGLLWTGAAVALLWAAWRKGWLQ